MERYRQNPKWLLYLAPCKSLSISAAYLTPFFLQQGLNLAQILVLQSIFSVAAVLWELPSGWIADRFGRAFSIKLSTPFAAGAFIAYGFSHAYWQFVIEELVLAIANGLISGIDTALLKDSLIAAGREDEFVKLSQRINALGFAATALGVPIAIVLVKYVSFGATITADGLLVALGYVFARRLAEAPRFNSSQEAVRASAWQAMRQLSANSEARWLIVLTTSLATATYLAFWLSAPYYQSLGIPATLFGIVLAVRSACKAALAHWCKQKRHVERNMAVYASLAGLTYLAMASGKLWLVWAVLGHDVVQALQSQPAIDALNHHMHHRYRATLNSLVNLVQRLTVAVAAPLAGWLAGHSGLHAAFLLTGITVSLVAFAALWRLHRFGTFAERR